ncbi:MAG TPA: glycosyltransferase family 2 protein [Candidatus Acidoferrum sp.]|nr:glycosyltransferase family 2 protein [Candidatus Acidoferrum sp.]
MNHIGQAPASSHEAGVDIVLPVYNERPEAVAATLKACLRQTHAISHIYVIDDGSAVPVEIPAGMAALSNISLERLPYNQKNAAARNAGIAKCKSSFIACVNCEVLPASDWLATCINYLSKRPAVGVCFTRTVPEHAERLLSRWRMRFQETKFGTNTGPAPFAPGHAVLFRREAIEKAGRYKVPLGNVSEDSEICERIRAAGWDTHFIAESQCISIQNNTITEFARKELSRNGWESPKDYPLSRLILDRSKWTLTRMGYNVAKGRFSFLPVDIAVWATAVKLAASQTLAARRSAAQSVNSADGIEQ